MKNVKYLINYKKMKNKGMITTLSIVYSILFIVSIFMIVLYFYKMRYNPISSNPEDWASFGNFIAPVISLFTLGAILLTLVKDERRAQMKFKKEKLEQIAIYINKVFDKTISCLQITIKIEKIKKEIISLKENNDIINNLQKIIDKENLLEEYNNNFIDMENYIEANISNARVYLTLYFNNELGIEIISNILYSEELIFKKENIDIGYVKTIVKQLRDYCFDNVKKLNEMYEMKDINDKDSDRLILLKQCELDKKYNLDLFRF